MTSRPLDIALGSRAAAHVAEHGWRGADISTLIGASGGPKWLILGHLDRVLFEEFLLRDRSRPLRAVGSSVGSWRHACLAQASPREALDRFEEVYVNWEYGPRPNTREVSNASLAMLADIFGASGARALIEHPLVHSYIITARGRGLNSARLRPALAAGMGTAAVANALRRSLLASQFQRVVFASPGAPRLPFTDFSTHHATLEEDTVARALHASGSIPFVLDGERNLPGGPEGHYWDGGIIDYHFDPEPMAGDGLLLYPHFRADLTTGWFDKFLPWRRHRAPALERMILISPSRAFVASLPRGKIPDRGDFRHLPPVERIRYWRACVERSRELAEDFEYQLSSSDPLQGTRRLDGAGK
ncbi:MAG: patatin-like phospholipase family protein [Pseudomonadota bacterium]